VPQQLKIVLTDQARCLEDHSAALLPPSQKGSPAEQPNPGNRRAAASGSREGFELGGEEGGKGEGEGRGGGRDQFKSMGAISLLQALTRASTLAQRRKACGKEVTETGGRRLLNAH